MRLDRRMPPAASPVVPMLALAAAVGAWARPIAAQAEPRLGAALLEAEVASDGSARALVQMELQGTEGLDHLPLRVLAFGAVPEEVWGSLDGGEPIPIPLTRVREGLFEGGVPIAGAGAAARRLRLEYHLAGVVHPTDEDGDGGPVMVIPWLAVPWPPPDGNPERVEIGIVLPAEVELEGAFPAGLSVDEGESSGRGTRRWSTSIPVLPSISRGRLDNASSIGRRGGPQGADGLLPGPGAPPPAEPPGFVFAGLFWAFLLVVVGYGLWMRGRA